MPARKLSTISSSWSGSAYTVEGDSLKRSFHRIAAKRLREVAKLLELPEGSYEVRSNKAGMAVSGEVTLHGERIYIQAYISVFGPRPEILYRTCDGRLDYTGDRNNYLPLDYLDKPELVAKACKRIIYQRWGWPAA